MKAQTFSSLLVLAGGVNHAIATWSNAPAYKCPGKNPDSCTSEQVKGFSWEGLEVGSFSEYNGFKFNGFSCANQFSVSSQFQSKCITGLASSQAENCPSFEAGGSSVNSFSVDFFEVEVEVECDLEFQYTLDDSSTCKHSAHCSPGGTTVSNTQCAGAKKVTVVAKESCQIAINVIEFHCSTGTSSSSSVPTLGQSTPGVPNSPSTYSSRAPVSSTPGVPKGPSSSSAPAPASSTSSVPYNKPSSSSAPAPVSSTPGAPNGKSSSSSAPAPVSSTPGVPYNQPSSSSAPAPVSSTPGVPNSKSSSSSAPAPVSSTPGVPYNQPSSSSAPGPVQSTPGVPNSRSSSSSAPAPVSSTPGVPYNQPSSSSAPGPVQSTPGVPNGKSSSSSAPAPVSSTPGVPYSQPLSSSVPAPGTSTSVSSSAVAYPSGPAPSSTLSISYSAPSGSSTPGIPYTAISSTAVSPYSTPGIQVTTVVVETTVTTCPVTNLVTANGTTSTQISQSVSTIFITKTSTVCTKCTETAVPASSVASAPYVQPTAACPSILPSCLNTWLTVTTCTSNTDSACFCPSYNLTILVFDCLNAHGASNEEIFAAQIYFQGICAPYAPQNPALVTGASSLPAAPPAYTGPSTVITVIATVVVPCTLSNSISTSSFTVVTSAVTVPQVVIQTNSNPNAVGVVPYPATATPGYYPSLNPTGLISVTSAPTGGLYPSSPAQQLKNAAAPQASMGFGVGIVALVLAVFAV